MEEPISKLRPDCRLLSGIPNWKPEAAVAINTGVIIRKPTNWDVLLRGNLDPHHDTGSYSPKDDWRPLSSDEIAAIMGVTDGDDPGSTFHLFGIPEDLYRFGFECLERHVSSPSSPADALGFFSVPAPAIRELIARVDEWIAAEICSYAGWHNNGMGVVARQAGHASSTGWGGLHADLWGPALAGQLSQQYNGLRLVINFGSEPRRFVFQNLRLATIARSYPRLFDAPPLKSALPGLMSRQGWQRLVGDAFVESNPGYPVLSVQLGPGHGYLGPTTTVFHDGCLVGMTKPDVTIRAGHSGFTTDRPGPWRAPIFSGRWLTRCLEDARH